MIHISDLFFQPMLVTVGEELKTNLAQIIGLSAGVLAGIVVACIIAVVVIYAVQVGDVTF